MRSIQTTASNAGSKLRTTMAAIGLAVMALAPTSASAAGYQMPITFSGYTNAPSKTESLTNFPVLVVFSNGVGSSGFSFASMPFATTNGYDLRFYTNATDTGSGLNYEIDTWNTNSACYVWVQAPLISTNGATAITARWGDPTVTNQLLCTTNGATWGNGYVAVYHFAQSSAPVLDSTYNRLNGTITGSPVWTNGSGVGVGGAWNFTQSTAQRINVANDARLCPANITVEAWGKQTSLTAGAIGADMMVSKGYDSSATVPWHLADYMSGSSGQFGFGSYFNSSWKSAMDVNNPTPLNIANYWSGTFNGSAFTLYKNGAYVSSLNYSASLPSGTRQLTIADGDWNGTLGTYRFTGLIDEVRISSLARSSNWLWACYQTMASNAVFNGYGSATAAITNLYILNGPTPSGANLGATQATVTATVVTNGGSDATGCLFYDTVNRGTNLTWAFTNSVAPNPLVSGGTVTNTITGLSGGTTYYFMYYATNTGGQACWGGSTGVAFTTRALSIVNGAAPSGANLSRTQAVVTATVTHDGGAAATGYIFYDIVNRGTNLTWAFTNSVAPNPLVTGGTVTNTITNLFANTTYYFMYYATNTAGAACWGGANGVVFTTPGASGGNYTTSYLDSANNRRYTAHIFTNSATASNFVPTLSVPVDVLVVAGGGSGGINGGGGGGAGGVIYSNAFPVVAGSNYTVNVGTGGVTKTPYDNSWTTVNGSNSVFGPLTAIGGGGGASRDYGPSSGASGGSGGGGGGGMTGAGANNAAGQGRDGGIGDGSSGKGGGGGGAGSVGTAWSATSAGNGGTGVYYSAFANLAGSPSGWFAGGGAGQQCPSKGSNHGLGGTNGGGGGVVGDVGQNGVANTGGGGGGGGGSGGSGIVIVRYASSDLYIQNGPAPTQGNLWTTQAVVTVTVGTNGGSDATGYLFWDTTDHGNALQWPCSSGPIALPASGVATGTMTNLAANTTYYFTYYATNTAGQSCWGGTTSLVFTTLNGAPAVTNTGASAVWYNTATLNGTLTTGLMAYCSFYWWANSAPATTNVVNIGWLNQGASFASAIGGLTFSTAYSYQCLASNNAGVAWSTVATFTTTPDSDAIWTNTSGGSFAVAANWDVGVPPPGRKATFLSNATYQVDFPASVTNKAADFEAPGGKVTLNIGAGNLWSLTNAFSLGTNAGAFATVAVTSGTLRASAGTMTLGNGVITNSGSGVVEVGTPGVTANSALYVAANTTCTVNQIRFRGTGDYDTWTIGGPGTLVLNNPLASPDFGANMHNTVLITNGTVRAGAVGALTIPVSGGGGWTHFYVTNAVLDMNGFNQTRNTSQESVEIRANAKLINSGQNATYNGGGYTPQCLKVYGTVEDGTPGDGAGSGVISFTTSQDMQFYRGRQTLNSLTGTFGLYSTNSTDHNTIYGTASGCTAYFFADNAGNISRTLGGKEADGTTDRYVTIGGTANLRIQGDGGANISNGSYTNNNDYSGGTMTLDRNDTISKNVTYTMRNLANAVTANTGTNGFRLKFWGTNTLTASSTHTVTGSLLINQIAESGGKFALTKAGTGTLELYGSSLFSTNIMQTGTNIISGSVTNRYVEIWSNAVLSMASSGYLKVTNNLVNTNGASTVKFTASPTALGRVDVTGIWSNSATTKLAVDLTGYTWPSGPRAVLATFQSMPTLFAAGNTTIAGAKAVSVYYTPTTLELRKMVGTAVFFQ